VAIAEGGVGAGAPAHAAAGGEFTPVVHNGTAGLGGVLGDLRHRGGGHRGHRGALLLAAKGRYEKRAERCASDQVDE